MRHGAATTKLVVFGKSLKALPKLERSRAHLSEYGKVAGIAACETTAKEMGTARRHCICVDSKYVKVV